MGTEKAAKQTYRLLLRAQQAATKNTATQGDGEKFSLIRKAEDGRSIYKTNYSIGTPKEVKQNELINLVQNIWSKNPVTLTVVKDGKAKEIIAEFNPELKERSDLSKMAFGNRKGTNSEKRMTLDLASDFYQIAQEAKYTGNKSESGKEYNPSHNDVFNWDYFVTNLVYQDENGQNIDCHMNIDVKQNSDGHWFYSFAIEKGVAPQTLLAVVTDKTATTPANSISNSNKNVKYSAKKSDIVAGLVDTYNYTEQTANKIFANAYNLKKKTGSKADIQEVSGSYC